MLMDERISENIYKVKFFAIISVICAHCCSVNIEHSFLDIYVSRILDSIGSVGVGAFMLVSGYLFHGTKKNFWDFFTSKIKSIIIPWVFCGTIVYFYVYLRKGGIGLFSLVKWILGVDTYLYFLTVLFVIYFLCYFIRKNKFAIYSLLVISIFSNVLTAVGGLDFISSYLNPFNFLIFFLLGLICAEYDFFDKLFCFSKKFLPYTLTAYFVLLLVLSYFNINVGYFKIFFIPVEILALLCLLGVSDLFSGNYSKRAIDIGKMSFAIYLLHMPFAGVVAKLCGKIDFFLLTLSRPIIVLILTYLSIKCVLKLFKNSLFEKTINILIGTR